MSHPHPHLLQSVMGIMYSSTNFLGMTNLMSAMPLIGYERVVRVAGG